MVLRRTAPTSNLVKWGTSSSSSTRIVVEDRSVTHKWPRVVDLLHRSAGGVLLLSLHSWSIHRLLGRPGRRFQLWSGRWPRVRSTWHRSAWWAGVSSESLTVWPKTEFRRRVIRSDTGPRPVRAATSEFLMWSCQRHNHKWDTPIQLGYSLFPTRVNLPLVLTCYLFFCSIMYTIIMIMSSVNYCPWSLKIPP